MHRQDRGMTCSLISILQGQVEQLRRLISKQPPNANRLMQTKPLSFGFSTAMNTMKVGSRLLYKLHSYIEVTYMGQTTVLLSLLFSIPYRLNGFHIEGSPLDSQCWVLGSWASIWSSPGFFVLEKSPPNSRDSSIFFFQFCLQVCTEHSDPSVLSTFS